MARWADRRRTSPAALAPDIIPLGDFNLPKVAPDDPIFRILDKRGLHLPAHSSQIGSTIVGDARYDQIAFFPGTTAQDFTGQSGVFDFDGAVFASLWQSRSQRDFNAYVRYHLSDHRPLWAEFLI